MELDLEAILTGMEDAGCIGEELAAARRLYGGGSEDEVVLLLRRCRCRRLEELHEGQRNLDRLDKLIRQARSAHGPSN